MLTWAKTLYIFIALIKDAYQTELMYSPNEQKCACFQQEVGYGKYYTCSISASAIVAGMLAC